MSSEIEICDGRRLLGVVREHPDDSFIAVIAEQVIGPFDTRKAATDALLDVVRSGGGQ